MFSQITKEDIWEIEKAVKNEMDLAAALQEIVNRCIQEDQRARLGALITVGEEIEIPDTIRYDGPAPVQLSVL